MQRTTKKKKLLYTTLSKSPFNVDKISDMSYFRVIKIMLDDT